MRALWLRRKSGQSIRAPTAQDHPTPCADWAMTGGTHCLGRMMWCRWSTSKSRSIALALRSAPIRLPI